MKFLKDPAFWIIMWIVVVTAISMYFTIQVGQGNL